MITEDQLTKAFSNAKGRIESVSFSDIKGDFLLALGTAAPLSANKNSSFSLTKMILISLAIIATAIAFYLMLNGANNQEKTALNSNTEASANQKPLLPVSAPVSVKNQTTERSSQKKVTGRTNKSGHVNPLLPKSGSTLYLNSTSLPKIIRKLSRTKKFNPKTAEPDAYRFPKLTEEEIKLNNKRKKKLIESIAALNFKRQKPFNIGTLAIRDSTISGFGFGLEMTEVSNLEYRIFLFDLLIHNRTDEFLIAQPQQNLWTELLGDSMIHFEQNYFSDEEYNDFPVVNVSRKGAEMYCAWLTTEARKVFREEYRDNAGVFRLPTRDEWLFAATDEKTLETTFPWGSDSTIREGCFQANYKLDNAESRLTHARKSKNDAEAITTAGYLVGKEIVIAKVESYSSSKSGLYNLCGNVAEMVYDEILPGTIGGGWMNTQDELKFDAEDPYSGLTDGHPNVGFRVIRVEIGGSRE